MPKKRKNLSEFLKMYYSLIESSNEEEYWKDIDIGDKPLYQISTHGRVRRKDNLYVINPFHSYRRKGKDILNNRPTYLRVQLYFYENGKRKRKHFEISRLVAKHFIPIPKKYIDAGLNETDLQVNHIKGGIEIYNNFVSNLEWCTAQENVIKSIDTGLRNPPYGEKHHSTFFSVHDVIMICECLEKGMSARETFDNISLDVPVLTYKRFKQNFYSIKYRKSWKFISQNYNF